MLSESEFRKLIKPSMSGVYLFFGEEDYLKANAIRNVRKAVVSDPSFAVFNDIRLDTYSFSAATLLNAVTPLPMMSETKLVTVSGLSISSMKKTDVDDLIDALKECSEYDYNTVIISVPDEEIDQGFLPKKPSKILRRFEEVLTPVYFEKCSNAKLLGWVKRHFDFHSVDASPAVCAYMIEYCGRSMFSLAAEIDKLCYYILAHGRNTATENDVNLISCANSEYDGFALTNALMDGRYEDLLAVFDSLKAKQIKPTIILGDVVKTLSTMLNVKKFVLDGYSYGEVAKIMNIKEARARLFAAKSASKDIGRISQMIALCADADRAIKSSSHDYLPLEILFCSL